MLDRFSSGTMLTEFEAERMFAWLHGLLDELPKKDKLAFVLREMEGMAYSEIAPTMETTELAVRIRVSRSKKKLLNRYSSYQLSDPSSSSLPVRNDHNLSTFPHWSNHVFSYFG